uniref:Secreted protein n=1 Tax=Ixodes ricinus TaxID=34613 RepID=A0A6B0U5U1_IXORI
MNHHLLACFLSIIATYLSRPNCPMSQIRGINTFLLGRSFAPKITLVIACIYTFAGTSSGRRHLPSRRARELRHNPITMP